MIPAEILFLSELPLTPNGKINHGELLLTQPAQAHAATPKATEPRTELEQQLVKIWETCLKVQPIGIHDNFFDLGGHSLLAMKVISKIEHQLGLPSLINQLFKTPTIAGISQVLACSEKATLPPYIVLIKSGKATALPLFLIHSAGPSILFYQPLVKLLQTKRPIYGVQSAFLSNYSLQIDSIEELAKRYVEQIRLVQPQGSYFIAGASLGGSIAYEIAQQLTRQGNEIGALILFDRAAPGGCSLTPAARRYQRYWKKFLQSGSSYLVTKLKSRIVFEFNQLRGKAKKIQHQIYKKLDLPTERFLKEEIHQRHVKLSQRYQPESYSGSIIVIRADQVPDSITILEEDLGWSVYVQGEVKVLQNPGGHMSMFKAPYVQTLAAQLDTLLARELT